MTSGSPRLTIVIPTVNRPGLVGRAIESALAQTYPELEIIVSANGSSDDTLAVLERYRGAPRLSINTIERTIPAESHGNLLLTMARGEFFLGLSDDDWLEPAFADKVISLYDRHAGVSFVWTGSYMHYADVATVASTGPELEKGTDFLAAFLAGRRNPCWCAIVTRTADLRQIGSIPAEVICGDMFYWTKLAAAGTVGCVPESLSHYTHYRDEGTGISGSTSIANWAREVEAWANDMVASCAMDPSLSLRMDLIRRNAIRFVARSTANQFIWGSLRGTSRLRLLRSVNTALPYVRGGSLETWLRIGSSIVAPKRMLKRVVLAKARHRRDRPEGLSGA